MDKTKNTQKTNKMGTMPIGKLLLNISLPITFSMLIQALYNIVDSIFVARIGENAMTSVTLAFPVMNFIIALGVGTGTGISALISRSLGKKDQEVANSAAENSVFINLLYTIAFILLGLFASEPFIKSQSTDPEVIINAIKYLKIISVCAGLSLFQIMFEKFFQSTGNSIYSMYTQASGAIVNIILDPILIFGLCGCPKMGVEGAAIATVIGQLVAVSVGFILHLWKNKEIKINLLNVFKPKWIIIKKIYEVGIPSIIMLSIGSIMTYTMNLILLAFSNTATAFFGVYFKLQSIVFMPVFGMGSGLIPIISYNYGSENKDRINEALKKSMIIAVVSMSIGAILFMAIPSYLLDLFNASEAMKEIGVPALRIISLSFPLAAFGITTGSVNSALSKSSYSLIISIARQLAVLLPVAYLFSLTKDINLIWWAFPIAEVTSAALSTYFFYKIYNDKIKPLPNIAPVPSGA